MTTAEVRELLYAIRAQLDLLEAALDTGEDLPSDPASWLASLAGPISDEPPHSPAVYVSTGWPDSYKSYGNRRRDPA